MISELYLHDQVAVRFLSSAAQADYNDRCYTPFLHGLLLGCPPDLRQHIPNFGWLVIDFDAEAKSHPNPWTISAIANLVCWVLSQHGPRLQPDMLELAGSFAQYKFPARGLHIYVLPLRTRARIQALLENLTQ